jgi:uncharacterized protein (TIGR03437 family)
MRIHTILNVFALGAMLAHGGEMPLLFEQHGAEMFRVRGNGYGVELDRGGMTLAAAGGAVRMEWKGTGALRGEKPQAARVSYLVGADAAKWKTGVKTFAGVRQEAVFPGVDVVYYGTARELEYDFVVKAGADPEAIRFAVSGEVDANGDLLLGNGMRWRKPVARQGEREIAARFVRKGAGEYGIGVSGYDRTRELVIDPVLTYGTYVGGSQTDDVRGVAVDAEGNTYVVGSTVSTDFPGTSRGQTFGGQDAFVAKLNSAGNQLIWATYIGGVGTDTGSAIAVDANGAVYVAGQTASNNFPVTETAAQKLLGGGSGVTDVFVAKLSPTGESIVYATYLGGSQSEVGTAIKVDGTGAAYVAGRTDSTDFPSTTRTTLPPRGAGDGFVTKVAPDGASWIYSSLVGGFALDVVNDIVVDAAGAVFLTGETRSDNFPVTETAYQKTRRGSADAFISKLAADGASLQFSTYFGGDGQESGRGIALDRVGNVYIAGGTGSVDMPVSFNAAQRGPALLPDAFAAKVDGAGTSLLFGTYLGGDGEEQANAITVDATGTAHVAGQTNSANFPLLNDGPLGAVGPAGGYDGFLTRISSGGNIFQYSTHYGGAGTDTILRMVSDGRGRFWVAGTTDSANLPVESGAWRARNAGATDGFVALLSEISVQVTPGTVTLGARESQQFSAVVANAANAGVRWSIFPEIGTITQAGLYTAPDTVSGSQTITVSAISLADGNKVGQAIVTLVNRVTVVVSPTEVTLRPGGSQQFAAVVSGTGNTAVTWTLTPAVGTITAAGLYAAPGSFVGESTVTVRATSVAEPSRFATAVVRLAPPPVLPAPVITREGFTNAASFRGSLVEGGVAPGELITVFGQNMGPAVPVTLQLDGRGFVANRLGGTRVLFDGTPAPMIVTSAGQLSVVAPYELEGKSVVSVQVEYEGRLSEPVSMPVTPNAPGIFTQNATGSGAASVIRQNGELITAANPAAVGEVLTLFATGEGPTNPTGIDGKPTDFPLPRPRQEVRLVIDGVEMTPLYAGGAPGLVAGVLQVNFEVPAGNAGVRRLRLKVGDKLSPDTVTVNVR